MREKKFRAWDKQTNNWLRFNDEATEWYNPRTGVFRSFFDRHVRLIQYIGLKDKNGQEIYEGDIISVKGEKWLVEHIGSEEKDGNRYGICVSHRGDGICRFIDRSILEGEVIGNIFENPELLDA